MTEVAVIHRPRYDDWSLPKGKVELDETDPVAAVREVHEETGYTAQLGRRLGSISYDIPQGTKRVWYWAARATGGDFTPNDEVDKLIWLPVHSASGSAGLPARSKSVAALCKKPSDTKTVLIVRHGTAGRRSRFKGDDRKRPLDKKGLSGIRNS